MRSRRAEPKMADPGEPSTENGDCETPPAPVPAAAPAVLPVEARLPTLPTLPTLPRLPTLPTDPTEPIEEAIDAIEPASEGEGEGARAAKPGEAGGDTPDAAAEAAAAAAAAAPTTAAATAAAVVSRGPCWESADVNVALGAALPGPAPDCWGISSSSSSSSSPPEAEELPAKEGELDVGNGVGTEKWAAKKRKPNATMSQVTEAGARSGGPYAGARGWSCGETSCARRAAASSARLRCAP